MSKYEDKLSAEYAQKQAQYSKNIIDIFKSHLQVRLAGTTKKAQLLKELANTLHNKQTIQAREWTLTYKQAHQDIQSTHIQEEQRFKQKIAEAKNHIKHLEKHLAVHQTLSQATKAFLQKITKKQPNKFNHEKETTLEYYFTQTTHALRITEKLIDELIAHEAKYKKYEDQEAKLLKALEEVAQNNRYDKQHTDQQAFEIAAMHKALTRIVDKQRKELTKLHADSHKQHNKIAEIFKYKTTATLNTINAALIGTAATLFTQLPTEEISQRELDEHIIGFAFVFATISAASITAITIREVYQKYQIQKNLE